MFAASYFVFLCKKFSHHVGQQTKNCIGLEGL